MLTRQSRHVEDPAPAIAACLGKEAFDSPALAHRICQRRIAMKGPQQVYRCRFCGFYHIGRPT